MYQEQTPEPIAVEKEITEGFVCLTTSRWFPGSVPSAGWKQGTEELERLLARRFGSRPNALVVAEEVHGNEVSIIDSGARGIAMAEKCDGLATVGRGVFLVILTADCVPVVLVDPDSGVFGCCHAGWRGTRGRIINELILKMACLGAVPERMRGWIGPAISQECYEVSPELAKDFQDAFKDLGDFTTGRHLDLVALNRLQAIAGGMKESLIESSGFCTFSDQDRFYSHRRGETVKGQQYTVCGFV